MSNTFEPVPKEEGEPDPKPAEGDVNDGGKFEVAPKVEGEQDPKPAEGTEVEAGPTEEADENC